MIQKFEAYLNKYGELQDFSNKLIFYNGNIAFIYDKYIKKGTDYFIYGTFTFADDARDMEKGNKFYQQFPGYIAYNPLSGYAEPILLRTPETAWDIFKDVYALDDLCQEVIDEIIE